MDNTLDRRHFQSTQAQNTVHLRSIADIAFIDRESDTLNLELVLDACRVHRFPSCP